MTGASEQLIRVERQVSVLERAASDIASLRPV